MRLKEKEVLARIYAIIEYLDGNGIVITDTGLLEDNLKVMDFKDWSIKKGVICDT